MTPPSRATMRAGAREITILAVLYVGYAAVRTFAPDDFQGAAHRAREILAFERPLFLDVERWLNDLFHAYRALEVSAGFYYAVAHYAVTAAVLLWLWVRRRSQYGPARTALAISSVVALVGFMAFPTAPPRLMGYHDVMALTSDLGWWGGSASAPKGLGHLTNELAAMPSMHAGWALWVALALTVAARTLFVKTLGWAHAIVTVVVIIGTGNHWTLDALVGWAIVLVGWWLTHAAPIRRTPAQQDGVIDTQGSDALRSKDPSLT